MSSLIIFSMTFSMLLTLPLMSQPLSLGLVIMLSTLFMCLVSAITLSQWYGYILFLIYVGGLLVMFAYVAALSPNVLFGRGSPIFLFLFSTVFLSVFFYFYPFIDSSSIGDFSFSSSKFLKMYGIELISPHMTSILIGLALILLINLIVVVKICYYQHASLRPFST
uniref:NADH dehydrogenase subunit 6 n=1 Tax=Californiconus californicus TaxID=1736779 RepID=A0A1L3N1L7_CONCL|nr:NADH dehydrogenase subunit 6 [Californiconus californicus]APH08595.1 NADH dehydrogenase subunit 6 [Californiconus californicus]